MKKLFILSTLALGLMLLLSRCSGSNATAASNPLVGKWSTTDSIKLEFLADGVATFNGTKLVYTVSNDTLTLQQGDNKISYNFKVNGDKLEISGGDLKTAMQYVKLPDESPTASKANSSGTNPGILSTKSGEEKQSESASATAEKTIYDTWISPEETIELRADGNCMYAGVAYKYTYDGKNINLTTQNGVVPVGCKLNGDQLTLTTNQGSFVYQRKGTIAKAGSTSSKGKGQELAGTWCYMSNAKNISFNDCFTIYANGTYTYNSDNSLSGNTGSVAQNSADNGTWTYDGNIIYVQSRLHGAAQYTLQKTYNKNGDPCIVLDGKTYFSAYQHARW